MKRAVVLCAFVVALAAPVFARADTLLTPETSSPSPSVADVLIHRDVINNNDDTIGTIDSVSVNPEGRVDYVVIDVSSWLRQKKMISVPWRTLSVDSDGNVRTTLTKDAVKKSADYNTKAKAGNSDAMMDVDDIYVATPHAPMARPF
jgi:hypothetical protein